MKRGYLLPDGCKDLIDVLKLKQHQEPKHPSPQPLASPIPLPPIVGEILVPEQASVAQLATLLRQKPFQIVADLMHFGVFATVKQTLNFEIISRVARKYGYIAKQAA